MVYKAYTFLGGRMKKLFFLFLCVLFTSPAMAKIKTYYSHTEVLNHVLTSDALSELLNSREGQVLQQAELGNVSALHKNSGINSVFNFTFRYDLGSINPNMLTSQISQSCFVSAKVQIIVTRHQALNSSIAFSALSEPNFSEVICSK
jgi:hypothetical protein